MGKFVYLSLIIFFCACVSKNHKETVKADLSLDKAIDKVVSQVDPNVSIGINVVDLTLGKTIVEKNSNRYFIPSSTQKIITIAAALNYLKPSFRFVTSLSTDDFNHHHMSIENLYLNGSGDPALMDHDLTSMIARIAQMGIKEVKGNIVVADGIFDQNAWGKGVMWDDRQKGFGAPVCGVNVNNNRIVLESKPNFKEGHKAFVSIMPKSPFVELINNAITVKQRGVNTLAFQIDDQKGKESDWPNKDLQGLSFGDKLIVSGNISLNYPTPSYTTYAIKTPSIFAGHIIADALKHKGIKFSGKITRTDSVKSGKYTLTDHTSKTLSSTIVELQKMSNNVGADALVKAIAAENGFVPASYEKGMSLIKKFLEENIGLKQSEIIVADGSGLSRYNLITPNQMVKILEYAYNKFDLGPEFMVALPISGSDGTLKNRLKIDSLKGNIRAKTGSMSGLSSLAGYTRVNNSMVAFAIFANGFIEQTKTTALLDRILGLIVGVDDAALAKIR